MHNISVRIVDKNLQTVSKKIRTIAMDKIKIAVSKILEIWRSSFGHCRQEGVIVDPNDPRFRVMVHTSFKYNSRLGGIPFTITIYLRRLVRRAKKLRFTAEIIETVAVIKSRAGFTPETVLN